MGRRFLKTVVLAACLLAGTVAVAGQESSTGTDVQPEPTRESSTGVTPEPTPARESSTAVPEPTPARESSSSTGVNPEPTPARESSSSTGDVRPTPSDMSSSSSGAYDSFSTGAAPFTTGLCDLLTTKLGYNNRDSQNEVTVLDKLITTAFLGSTDTQNGIRVGGIVNSVILKPYFDGSINYRQNGPVRSPYAKSASPDYTKDENELTRLKNKLIAFFGQQAALGCSAEGFPTYTLVGDDDKNYNQFQAHSNMNISGTEFTLFNAQIINAAQYYGADATAQTAISNKLAAFGRTNIANANQNEICHTDSCPCAFGIQGTNCDGQVSAASSSFQASFVSLAVVAAGALLAMAL